MIEQPKPTGASQTRKEIHEILAKHAKHGTLTPCEAIGILEIVKAEMIHWMATQDVRITNVPKTQEKN